MNWLACEYGLVLSYLALCPTHRSFCSYYSMLIPTSQAVVASDVSFGLPCTIPESSSTYKTVYSKSTVEPP